MSQEKPITSHFRSDEMCKYNHFQTLRLGQSVVLSCLEKGLRDDDSCSVRLQVFRPIVFNRKMGQNVAIKLKLIFERFVIKMQIQSKAFNGQASIAFFGHLMYLSYRGKAGLFGLFKCPNSMILSYL